MNKKEQGNVLFIILIGIVLFGTLSVAIIASDNDGKGTQEETLSVELRQLLEHINHIKQVTNTLTSVGLCTEKSIRFWDSGRANSGASAYYGDGSNSDCQVFHADGGGVPYKLGGINLIGLKRRGFSLETRNVLARAFKIIYRSGLRLSDALEKIENELDPVPELQSLIQFCRNSKRGIIYPQENV